MDKKKKFQSGAASVLDDPDILDVIPQIRRPNLMGDPTKLGAADLGPLLAMMAAGTYPAVSAMTEAEARDRGIIIPPDELSEEEKKRLASVEREIKSKKSKVDKKKKESKKKPLTTKKK